MNLGGGWTTHLKNMKTKKNAVIFPLTQALKRVTNKKLQKKTPPSNMRISGKKTQSTGGHIHSQWIHNL